MRQRGAGDRGRAEQVDGDDALPRPGVDLVQASARVDAGGGDDAGQVAVLGGHALDGGLGGARVGEVDLGEARARPAAG